MLVVIDSELRQSHISHPSYHDKIIVISIARGARWLLCCVLLRPIDDDSIILY